MNFFWGSDIDIPRKTACWSYLGQSHGLERFPLCSLRPIHIQEAVIISSIHKNINTPTEICSRPLGIRLLTLNPVFSPPGDSRTLSRKGQEATLYPQMPDFSKPVLALSPSVY